MIGGRLYLGVDVGGSSTKVGLVDRQGHLLVKDKVPTRAEDGWPLLVAQVGALTARLCESARIAPNELAGCGVGLPGWVDRNAGVLVRAPNLGWQQVPLGPVLEQSLGMAVTLENDANAAAWGEYLFGSGAGRQSLFLVTVGTGIGSGFVLEGRLYRGPSGLAPELGHLAMDPEGDPCNCGARGCLETLASGTAMARRMARALAQRGEEPGRQPEIRQVLEAAEGGDALAGRVVAETAAWLGRGLTAVALLLEPEVIAIGGGVGQTGEVFVAPLREEFERRTPLFSGAARPKLMAAGLGNAAGIVGAAGLAMRA